MTATPRPTLISMIVAADRRMAIGRRGDMLFHIPTDLRHFKAMTMGKPVIMGRRTWESLPGGALPGRRNIVITRQRDYAAAGAETAASLAEAIAMVEGSCPEAVIIGGGEIYRQALPLARKVYLTHIDAEAEDADTFFPSLPEAEWEPVDETVTTDQKSQLLLRFVCYCRK